MDLGGQPSALEPLSPIVEDSPQACLPASCDSDSEPEDAICGVRSLGMPLAVPWGGSGALASLGVDLFVGWLPLIGSALLLHGTQRMLSASRP